MLTEPVVDPHIGDEVPNEEVGESELTVEEVESTGGDGKTNIRKNDQFTVLGFVQRACRTEVVDSAKVAICLSLTTTFNLTFVVVVSSYICE